MPDITMCSNEICDLRETCYRFKAEPGPWQSFTTYLPNEDGTCDHWMELRPTPKKGEARDGE